MIRLTQAQLDKKKQFIESYKKASNAATGSKLDANANVTTKTAVTLQAELNKDINIQVNRSIIQDKIRERFGEDLAEQYVKDIESHLLYVHDESSLLPYCCSISMYPFLLEGMKCFGEENASDAPEHLRSFCGGYVNLVQYVAANFAGAVATTEFLLYFDYFARKDFGDDYLFTHKEVVKQELQGVVYLLNQETSARNGQSVFSNIATFDEGFFNGIFGGFVFPDLTPPKWETLNRLQRFWHVWFREERTKKLLTFPVVTHCALANEDGTDWADTLSADFIANEMSKGGEFFIYTSDTADSLSSCCRLKNAIVENDFSYSLGAGGVATGSKNVITMNMNRLIQSDHVVGDVLTRVHKYQVAYNDHVLDWVGHDLLPVYTSGMITPEQQYLTIGVNGVVEAAEYLGLDITNNDEYKAFLCDLLGLIKRKNKAASSEYGVRFNTEFVPAENLGVKNALWDRADGLEVPRDCYNSYMYIVEEPLNLIDKLELHGGEVLKNLDGGSAVHWNNTERCTAGQYRSILRSLIRTGSNYFCENVKKTCCNECKTITANTLPSCPECGSTNVDYAERVIGYLKRIKNFSEARQAEDGRRYYD